MSKEKMHPHHQKLVLKNFTAFGNAKFNFVPGVNVFIGENGTGKTHILKMMYALQKGNGDIFTPYEEKFNRVFQTGNPNELMRHNNIKTSISGNYENINWKCEILPTNSVTFEDRKNEPIRFDNIDEPVNRFGKSVFIPAVDMMGHTKFFTSTYDNYRIDFDETYRDIVSKLLSPDKRKLPEIATNLIEKLSETMGGKLELEGERFYLKTTDDRKFSMTLVAEGLRKIATLIRLVQVGALEPGSTLYWDEPEANLNPKLMDEVVRAILTLARSGVQVFLATHSYVILKELDLQLIENEQARYFTLSPGATSNDGTQVGAFDSLAEIEPNAILEQYGDLYERELDRATKRITQIAH